MTATKPTQEAVRIYMQQRREQSGPPPSPERIRQMLGWHLIPSNRSQD